MSLRAKSYLSISIHCTQVVFIAIYKNYDTHNIGVSHAFESGPRSHSADAGLVCSALTITDKSHGKFADAILVETTSIASLINVAYKVCNLLVVCVYAFIKTRSYLSAKEHPCGCTPIYLFFEISLGAFSRWV